MEFVSEADSTFAFYKDIFSIIIGPCSVFALLTTRKAAWYIVSILSLSMCVCMYVCQTITFKGLEVGSSYIHIQCISIEHEGHRVKVKAAGAKNAKICIPAV